MQHTLVLSVLQQSYNLYFLHRITRFVLLLNVLFQTNTVNFFKLGYAIRSLHVIIHNYPLYLSLSASYFSPIVFVPFSGVVDRRI
jgi:hypothetical protein